jgi:hypothetical protein
MPLGIAISQNQYRNDSTILPIVTISGYAETPLIKLHNWQYFEASSDSFVILPNNRSMVECPVTLRDCFHDFAGYTLDAPAGDFSIVSAANDGIKRNGGTVGGSFNGAYYTTPLDGDIVSIQAKAKSTQLSSGIYLQDSPFASHNLLNADVAHGIIFGENGRLSIREFGAIPPSNNASSFRYEENDIAMIEYDKVKNVVRYYLIKDGVMNLLRTTRPKFTTDPIAGVLLYFPDSLLENVLICNGEEVTTIFENIGVAIRKEKVHAWQKYQNQRNRFSTADPIQLADGEFEYTFPSAKQILRQLALTPGSYNAQGFQNIEDFFGWHGNEKEFIFVDNARKDTDGNNQEFWARFSGAITDQTGNKCVFTYNSQILEAYRGDYVPRLDDLNAPSITTDSIDSGTYIVVGTAADDVLLTSVQLYVNGQAYGAPFLPDSLGDWTFEVDDTDLISGTNSFYAIATDYAGNQTQSNTITLEVGAPIYIGEFTLGGEAFTLGGEPFTLGV